MFGAMNKSIKTFGKAMSQVSEEFKHLADDTSIGAQSHAQVGRIGLEDRGYAFAARLSSLRGHILLDNQSSVHVFCDPNLVLNIWKASRQLSLKINGSMLPISDIATLKGFEELVWFSEEAMTNIVGLFMADSRSMSLTRRLVVRVSVFSQHEKRNRLGKIERFAERSDRMRTDNIVQICDLQS